MREQRLLKDDREHDWKSEVEGYIDVLPISTRHVLMKEGDGEA